MKSVKSFKKSSDILTAVSLHCEMLPEYMPIKWGWYEPLRQDFDPLQLDSLIYKNGKTDHVWWKRTGKHKAEGSWMKRWISGVAHLQDTHSTVDVAIYETTHQEKLLQYLKKASEFNKCDFGFLDSVHPEYAHFGAESDWVSWARRGDLNTAYNSVSTHTLRHWLPDMPWTVVFGPAYVRLFGKERLLTCPAYKVEDIGDEMVFIQLTENMADIHEKYEEVMQARALAKKHLGEECFFKPELAYDYKGGIGCKLTQEEIEAKRGKVFRVPEFNLEPD